jgi:hypothetical protein
MTTSEIDQKLKEYLEPARIKRLGESVRKLERLDTAARISWVLYSPLWRVVNSLGPRDNPSDYLGWSPQLTTNLLDTAYRVAGKELEAPDTEQAHGYFRTAFRGISSTLANRMSEMHLGSSVADWTVFDGTMLDAYEATMESPDGTAFIIREGHFYSMASAIKNTETVVNRAQQT